VIGMTVLVIPDMPGAVGRFERRYRLCHCSFLRGEPPVEIDAGFRRPLARCVERIDQPGGSNAQP